MLMRYSIGAPARMVMEIPVMPMMTMMTMMAPVRLCTCLRRKSTAWSSTDDQ